MSENYLSTGVKVAVDTTELDVKFAKSAERLNETLTKSQKALGLFYDENGRLNNSLGQVVEGLTQAQIKLGQYVDDDAKVRTFQGGFVEGLTKIQIALGMCADELGNVYNASGEFVGQTAAATRALEAQAQEARDAFDGALGGVEQFSGQFAQLFATLQIGDGPLSKTAAGIVAISEGVSASITAFEAARQILPFLRNLRLAIQGASAAQAILNALSGNWVALAAGAAAGGAVLWATLQSGESEVEKTANAFDELAEKAKKAGIEIKNAADAARFGFADAFGQTTYAEERAREKELEAQIAEQQILADEEKARNNSLQGGMSAAGAGAYARYDEQNELNRLNEQLVKSRARLVELQKPIIDAAVRDALTEAEKLEAQKADLEAILENVEKETHRAAIKKQISAIDKKIADENQKKLDAAAKTAEDAAKAAATERENRLKTAGIFDYLPKAEAAVAETVETFAKTVENWRAALDSGDATREQFDGAVENLKNAIREKLEAETGVVLDATDDATDDADEIATARKKWLDALNAGVVSQNEYDAALKNLAQTARDDAREALFSELGVNPETLGAENAADGDEYESGMRALNLALREGTITAEEEAALAEQLRQTARDALGYSALLNDAAALEENGKSALEKLDEERQKYADALKSGRITQEEHDKALAALDAKERASRRSELGIDALLESLKTPLDRYRETLDQIDEALTADAIDRREAGLLRDKAERDYWANFAEKSSVAQKAAQNAAKIEKSAPELKSATAGSSAVYSMAVDGVKSQWSRALQYAARQTELARENAEWSSRNWAELNGLNAAVGRIASSAPVWGER